MNISFAICTHNETTTLEKLLERIKEFKYQQDEIVILDDYSTNEHTLDILKTENVTKRKLNNNYGSHKNFLNSLCSRDFIFQLDADELPTEPLLKNLHTIIKKSKVELFKIPRVNIVNGITDIHLKQWKWKKDHLNRINYPDFQTRLYKNSPTIKWKRHVHEIISGHKYVGTVDPDSFHDLIHVKDIKTQEESNRRYYQNYTKDFLLNE
jgi:glycosyltransferase involved in cell wall biosynthesis